MKVVLISGAAGGLGRVLVETFLAAGYGVGAGLHRAGLPVSHPNVEPVVLDVRESAQAEAARERVLSRFGRIDVLVNNAGLTVDGPLARLTEADWNHVLGVNLRGVMQLCRAVTPVMVRQKGGHVINLGSYAGRAGSAGQGAYAAAKAGVLGLTQSLAAELAGGNVKVNAVLPGVMLTGMTQRLPAERRAALAAANALGRLNSLDEVARFIVMLAGMENVSGQVFQLDSRIVPWG